MNTDNLYKELKIMQKVAFISCFTIVRNYKKTNYYMFKYFTRQTPHKLEHEVGEIPSTILKYFTKKLKAWNTSQYITENQFVEQNVEPLIIPLFEEKPDFEIAK
jgi:hypothetical protein